MRLPSKGQRYNKSFVECGNGEACENLRSLTLVKADRRRPALHVEVVVHGDADMRSSIRRWAPEDEKERWVGEVHACSK